MRLIEQFSSSSAPRVYRNEDRVYFDGRFAAVIDGKTDLTGLDYEGMSGGEWAAEKVCETLHAAVDGISAMELISYATERVGDGARRIHPHLELDHTIPTPSASLCVYSADAREIWRVGDCSWWMRDPESDFEIQSPGPDNYSTALGCARAALVEIWLRRGVSVDEMIDQRPEYEAIRYWSEWQHLMANDTESMYSQGLINGVDVPEEMIEITPVPAGVEVVMVTDGYPILCSTLEATEHALQNDLAEDPLRIGAHPALAPIATRGASFDNRSYLRIKTQSER